MIAHENARRGQVLYARPLEHAPARKRLTSQRRGTKDDKGRETMPFDLFLCRSGDLVELMADVFGGEEFRDVLR